MKHTFGMICLVLAGFNVFAQEVAVSDVPSVVLNSFQMKFSNAKDVEWELDSTIYKVEFEIAGEDYDVWITSDGGIKRQCVEVRKNDLPEVIKNKIDSEFKNFRIDDVSRIEENDTQHFEVDLDSFSEDRTVVFTADGTIRSNVAD